MHIMITAVCEMFFLTPHVNKSAESVRSRGDYPRGVSHTHTHTSLCPVYIGYRGYSVQGD